MQLLRDKNKPPVEQETMRWIHRKKEKPFIIEWKPLFHKEWTTWSRYETKGQREMALRQLNKSNRHINMCQFRLEPNE